MSNVHNLMRRSRAMIPSLIPIASMAKGSNGVFTPWEFVTMLAGWPILGAPQRGFSSGTHSVGDHLCGKTMTTIEKITRLFHDPPHNPQFSYALLI